MSSFGAHGAQHQSVPAGNIYDKYHARNPVYRYLIGRFMRSLDSMILSLECSGSILEVGCGEGYLLDHIRMLGRFSRLEGIDISEEIVMEARTLHPLITFGSGSVYDLHYESEEFDLVLAAEVLEHLEDYETGLSEIRRVAREFCIISVPLEPLWRVLNIARGAYISSLGNTPGHIQHWGKTGLLELLKQYFIVLEMHYPLPWQMALCRKR
jgi:ubiquinone/menaquinone biosynthesis C-methylase UbiE